MIRWCLLLSCGVLAGCMVTPAPELSDIQQHDQSNASAIVQVTDDGTGCVVLPPDEEQGGSDETSSDEALLNAQLNPPEEVGAVVEPEPLFDFPVVENDKVRYLVEHYTGPGRRTFTRWMQRSSRYLPMMREIFAREGLPQDLATLAMVESGFNSNAHSWANAVGHWQFIESTGRMYGLDNDWWRDERRDVEKATLAAARYLKDLYQRFDGNWYLAVASYNAGPGKISRAIKKYHTTDFWELSKGSYLQDETKNYVPKLLAALLISKQPLKYGFCDLEYEAPLMFDTVLLSEATDLEVVAELTGASYDDLKQLNTELKRWCTPPGMTNYRLRVPTGCGIGFDEKYAAVPSPDRARYKRHQIKSGDTLLRLAQQYHIRVDDIISLNHIKNPRALKIGQNLILPLHRDFTQRPLSELADDYQYSRRRHYTVRSGDSLWSIAKKCDVTEKQLRVWNRLGWSNVIRPGQKLLVSAPSSGTRVAAKTKTVKKVIYQVRSGDTLWGIGRQFSVHTRDIRQWNDLDENHILQPGDELTLLVQGDRRS
ncbi:MAG: lytic transglycosylase [Desulfuromonas sp.]|nr:MAG: lytic transglycosylase [Desulfuromonas sp.]